jgi:hypothetical protein
LASKFSSEVESLFIVLDVVHVGPCALIRRVRTRC